MESPEGQELLDELGRCFVSGCGCAVVQRAGDCGWRKIGYQLEHVQEGMDPDDWKPMPTLPDPSMAMAAFSIWLRFGSEKLIAMLKSLG
jgi:hypothetical protein